MRAKRIAVAILLAFAAAAGWYFESPGWTLRQMAAAAQARDADKLSAYIDYPKLRESTKSQLKAAMTAKLASGTSNGFEALGMMFGMTMVDNMIDGLFTPEGMEAMFATDRAKQQLGPAAKKPFGLDASHREIVRDGFDRFRLHDKSKPDREGDLVFERHGLGWKLAKIEVPPNLFNEKK
jgi:hypothetical protein